MYYGKKITKLACLLMILPIAIAGCIGGNSVGNQNSKNTVSLQQVDVAGLAATVPQLRLSELGVLPKNGSYHLLINNYGNKKYNLVSLEVLNTVSNTQNKTIGVSDRLCKSVSANGDCSLLITPVGFQTGSVRLVAKFKSVHDEQLITLEQVISVGGNLGNNGIIMQNNHERIISQDGNYSISLPVFLNASYNEIKASNGTLTCSAPGFGSGNSCTYHLRGKVGKNGAVIAARLEGYQGGTLKNIQETNIRVDSERKPNLQIDPPVSVINHPQTYTDISVINNGMDTAENVQFLSEDRNLTVTSAPSDGCANTIAANASCKLRVSLKSGVSVNLTGTVSISYKSNGQEYKTSSNVEYTVANPQAAIGIRVTSNNLSNAIVGGKTRIADLILTNNGKPPITTNGLVLAPINGDIRLVGTGTNPCVINGSGNLTEGQSCQLQVRYQANREANASSIILKIKGQYEDEFGTPVDFNPTYGLNYSASKPLDLVWQHKSGFESMEIQANNLESKEGVWSLNNSLANDEGIAATLTDNINLTAGVNALSVIPLTPERCSKDGQLAGGDSCDYTVKYGPTSNLQAATEVALRAKYKLQTENRQTDSRAFKVTAKQEYPSIGVEVFIRGTQPGGLAGDGITNITPWKFAALDTNILEVNYKFTNTSRVFAVESFNVDVGTSMPIGVKYIPATTTCPVGGKLKTLNIGESCIVSVSIPDPWYLNIPNSVDMPTVIGSELNGALLSFTLPFSRKYSGKILYNDNVEYRRYVQFSRTWADVTHVVSTSPKFESATREWVGQITSTVNSLAIANGISYPLTVKSTILGATAPDYMTHSTCQIRMGETSCTGTVRFPEKYFTPGETERLTMQVSAPGMADKQVLRRFLSVTLEK